MKAWVGQGRFSHHMGTGQICLGKFASYLFAEEKKLWVYCRLWCLFLHGTSLVAAFWYEVGKKNPISNAALSWNFPAFSTKLLEVRFEGSDVQFLTWQMNSALQPLRQEEVQANVRVSWGPTSYTSLGAGTSRWGLESCWGWGSTFVGPMVVGWLVSLPNRLITHHVWFESELQKTADFFTSNLHEWIIVKKYEIYIR